MPLSELSIAVAALIIGLVGGVVAVRALKAGQQQNEASVAVRALEQRLDIITAEMNRTFAQALQQATQSLNGTIGNMRDETRAVREETRAALQQQSLQVTQTLGDLKATNNRILEQSRASTSSSGCSSRRSCAATSVNHSRADAARPASAEHYECQASIGNGRVDALIRTPYGALCIDCKFPLDNFRRALQEGENGSRDAAMKQFYSTSKGASGDPPISAASETLDERQCSPKRLPR